MSALAEAGAVSIILDVIFPGKWNWKPGIIELRYLVTLERVGVTWRKYVLTYAINVVALNGRFR